MILIKDVQAVTGVFSYWFYASVLDAGFEIVEQNSVYTRVSLRNLVKRIYKKSGSLILAWILQLSYIGLYCLIRGD